MSAARDEPFKRRFPEMAGVRPGVVVFSFLAGLVMRSFLGVDV
jgi:hypothetical protein